MSNSVTKVEIQRVRDSGVWKRLKIRFKDLNGSYSCREKENLTNGDEKFAVSVLLTSFLLCYSKHFVNANLYRLRSDIVKSFRQLRENNLYGNSQKYFDIAVVPKKRIRTHSSCKEEDSTPRALEENGISQSVVKQKLVNLDKGSRKMKFFEENKCSVCLCSYKKLLNKDLHIVVPLCGHPLCCDCADNIMMSTKKELLCCEENITAQSFNLMKFNADLNIDTQDQTVFCKHK